MMKLTKALFFTLAIFGTGAVQASNVDKMNAAFNELCDKMEQCAMEQMGKEQDLTPEMRSMIEGMIEGMCKNMMDVGEVNEYAELVDPAVACIDSMTSKSCSELQGDNVQTPECKAYERQAEEFGADFNGE